MAWTLNKNLTGIVLAFVLAVAVHGEEPVQVRLHKSLKLWSFYVDLEESLGTLESTRKIYERLFDLKIATPQIVLNYAALLEVGLYLIINHHGYLSFSIMSSEAH